MKWTAVKLAGVVAAFPAKANPATPNANHYATCLANSIGAKTFYRNGRYLEFACYGTVAGSFFAALGNRPSDVAYEESHDDGTYRFTEKPEHDTSGLDYCRHAPMLPGQQE